MSLEVFFTLSGGNRLQSTGFHLDLAFDQIIINENQINCQEPYGCNYIGIATNYDIYNYTVYAYRDARITLIVLDETDNEFKNIEIGARVGNYPNNILGLNPYSILKEVLSKKSMILDLTNKQVKIGSDEPGDPLSVFVENGKMVHYFKSKLEYTLNVDYQPPISHYNTANICFHDRDVTAKHNFFLSGSSTYLFDWLEFLENYSKFKNDIRPHEYTIISSNNLESFRLTYDNNIFKHHKHPFNIYESKYYDFCELYMGNLAILSGGIKLILNSDPLVSTLIVKIQTNKIQNIVDPGFHYLYIVYTVVMFVVVMAILHYFKRFYEQQEENDDKHIEPMIEAAFEKGQT